MNDTSMTRKTDPKYDDDLVNKRYVDKQLKNSGDTVPVGSIFDYDGTVVPDGYEQIYSYSTSEVKTGDTWIDGKSIYSKVYETTTSIPGGSFTSITIAHNISNVDKIWVDNSVSRIETVNSPYMSYSLPLIGYEGNTTDKVYAKADRTNITIYGQGWGTSWRKIICVLYTKTTD